MDQSVQTNNNLNDAQVQTVNTAVNAQIQTSNELLEKYFYDVLLENSTATSSANLNPTEFIEQVRYNPEYTDFFNRLDNMVLNWQNKIHNPMSPSIDNTGLESPIATSSNTIISTASNVSTETVLPILIKSQRELIDKVHICICKYRLF